MEDLGEGPGAPGISLFLGKKKGIAKKEKPAGQATKNRPLPLAQGLGPPLTTWYVSLLHGPTSFKITSASVVHCFDTINLNNCMFLANWHLGIAGY